MDKCSIVTAPYPNFPTDLAPISAPLLAYYYGGTIKETVWPSRFGYLKELSKFGLKYSLIDACADILPSVFHSASVRALDLRGGAAALISALISHGKSCILNAEILNRVYEELCGKLTRLGARIKCLKDT